MADEEIDRLWSVVRQRAAHLRLAHGSQETVLERAAELHFSSGLDFDSAVVSTIEAVEQELIVQRDLNDRHHLLADLHPSGTRGDPLFQTRLAHALELRKAELADPVTSRAARKAALLEALESGGVDVSESALLQACSAPVEYSADLRLGLLQEQAYAREQAGDVEGVDALYRLIKQEQSRLDELRRDPGAIEVPGATHLIRAQARREFERREDEACVAWCRKYFGSTGGPTDPEFDVPLAYGGPPALLMRADLSSQAGADRFLAHVPRIPRDAKPPTLKQLRMAQQVCRGVGIALQSGADAIAWALVDNARDALFSKLDARRAIVNILVALVDDRRRDDEYTPRVRGEKPGEWLHERCKRAIEDVARVNERFRDVSQAFLLELIRDDGLSPMGIAAKLSLMSGAFGDEQRANETTGEAFKRVKKLYEKACASTTS